MQGPAFANQVPIFPLNAVLFPRMPIALHIFEARYRAMVEDLRGTDGRFCVALIREGMEVGGGAEPFSVGCLAEIAHLQELPDGRFNLIALGVERVHITEQDLLSKPYLTGSVVPWPDEGCVPDEHLVQNALRMFTQYVDYLINTSRVTLADLHLPSEPEHLSYLLATTLQIEPLKRQELLEMPGSEERLHAEVEILKSELPILHALIASPRPPKVADGRFSAN